MRCLHVNRNLSSFNLFDKTAVKSKLNTGLHESKLSVEIYSWTTVL